MNTRPDTLPMLLRKLGRGPRNPGRGRVYLIGAGPGDLELLTLGALKRLREADVVLYDRLVGDDILALAHPRAELRYVGKHCGDHSLPQARIEALMIELAGAGKVVARLKGGDPFIFGRGGEEVQSLTAAGVPVEVIPGVTAASGCASYAGIPLTHRDYARGCLFVTAHRRDGPGVDDWEALVRPQQTVAVYMGLGGLGELCRGLIWHGLPADWPVAVVEKGTTAEQRVVIGGLNDIAERVRSAGLQGPALTIVGEVVRLAGAGARGQTEAAILAQA